MSAEPTSTDLTITDLTSTDLASSDLTSTDLTSTEPRRPRMTNPAFAVPDAFPALAALGKAVLATGLPPLTAELAHIRASQINGCGTCVVQHQRTARQLGADADTLYAVAAWRDAPYFSAGERVALELAEELSRFADRGDAVPDELWERATAEFDEPQLAALLLTISSVNLWNRINRATRQPAGLAW